MKSGSSKKSLANESKRVFSHVENKVIVVSLVVNHKDTLQIVKQ